MELAPNIYWIDKVNANVFACLEPDGVTLIDTGLPSTKAVGQIFDYLHQLGRSPNDIKQIVLTHTDSDHAGNVAELLQKTEALVWVSSSGREHLVAGKAPMHLPKWMHLLTEKLNPLPPVPHDRIRVFDLDHPILPILGGVEVIETVGHTMADHVSLYHSISGVMFAGDALATIGGRLRLLPGFIAADLARAKKSAVMLLEYSPKVWACGHGKPLAADSLTDLVALRKKLV